METDTLPRLEIQNLRNSDAGCVSTLNTQQLYFISVVEGYMFWSEPNLYFSFSLCSILKESLLILQINPKY